MTLDLSKSFLAFFQVRRVQQNPDVRKIQDELHDLNRRRRGLGEVDEDRFSL